MKSKKKTNTKKYNRKYNKKTKKHSHSNHSHSNHSSINILSQLQKPIHDKNYTLLPKLKGGKFIDKGGFGCVVTPALPCTINDKNLNLDKYVSKIVRDPENDDVNNETKISNILQKIDPLQKYFITFENKCFINYIPNDRNDLISVKYKDSDLTSYDTIGDSKGKDKHVCDIDISLKPMNLIMKHGGISLSSIMKADIKGNSTLAKMHGMFLFNLKYYFKHLIIGIIKMHENNIANRDIKQKNILLNLVNDKTDTKNNKDSKDDGKDDGKHFMEIKYIDFGLSDFITSDMYKNTSHIHLKGTYFYVSPELFISSVVKKYYNRSRDYQIKKIMHDINGHVKKALIKINEKVMLTNLEKTIETIYGKIKYLFDNDRLMEAYFGSSKKKYNGYVQKGDVYSLGITIYEFLYYYSKINVKKSEKLYDLLSHMINLDPDKRYNAIQCLAHPYFKS